MPAKAKFNKSYQKKKERIKKLPKLSEQVMYGMRKQDAADFVKIFHDGIKEKKISLPPALISFSKQQKKKAGYELPNVPLYGKGDQDKKRSYVNMLRIAKLKNGWKLFPSLGKHHKSNMKLRDLLDVHERGRTIAVTPKMRNYLHSQGLHLSPKTTMIRIPPRPAFFITTSIFLKRFHSRRNNEKKLFEKALKEYINTGHSEYFNKFIDIYKNKYNDLKE